MYLGSTVQNDREIEEFVNYHIQYGWLKLSRDSGVLCDKIVPLKLKENLYQTTVRLAMLYGT